jgi:hypothetical protein
VKTNINNAGQEVSPDSPHRKLRWAHENLHKRQQVAYDWDMICTAHKILTTPEFRGQYDSSRISMFRDKEKRDVQATKDELVMLLAKKNASEKRLEQAKLEQEQSAMKAADNVEHAKQEQKRKAVLADEGVKQARQKGRESALLAENMVEEARQEQRQSALLAEKKVGQAKQVQRELESFAERMVDNAMRDQNRLAMLAKKEVDLAEANDKELAVLIEAAEIRQQIAIRQK